MLAYYHVPTIFFLRTHVTDTMATTRDMQACNMFPGVTTETFYP